MTSWTERAWASELPAARARIEAAICQPPGEDSLRGLAAGALAGGPAAQARGAAPLTAAQTDAVVAQLEWGVTADSPAACFDAAHAAAELGLREASGLVEGLWGLAQPRGRRPPSVRARAVEAYGALAPVTQAASRLEGLAKDDPSWTVRRLAGEWLHQLQRGAAPAPSLLHRYDALTRCGRLRAEVGDDPVAPDELAALGLRFPPTYLAFLAGSFPGGRLVHVEDDPKGKEQDGLSLRLLSPAQLDLGGPRPGDLASLDEYVWARYVDGARRYPKVDEDFALRRYADHYDRGRVDADAYNYGILLFEAAFGDEARRAELLLRCRDVLLAYRDLTLGDPWDVVDDRLEEVAGILADEGLSAPAGRCEQPLRFGVHDGVVDLAFDLLAGDVWGRDPEVQAELWPIAATAGLFLNELVVPRPGDAGRDDPLALLLRAGREIDAGNKKAAGRLFADALEGRADPAVPAAAAGLLQRDDMTPLASAQLLATVPLAGDRASAEAVRSVLQALPVPACEALLEAIAPYDEEGSQVALLINAAAGLRKKSHAEVKQVAKRIRDVRGGGHIRTLRNPWYR